MNTGSDKVWQSSEARASFPDVIDRALAGHPQFIRKRSGEEVVLISKKDFEAMKPTLKDFLLTSGYAGKEGDAFDEALKTVRSDTAGIMAPRDTEIED